MRAAVLGGCVSICFVVDEADATSTGQKAGLGFLNAGFNVGGLNVGVNTLAGIITRAASVARTEQKRITLKYGQSDHSIRHYV